MKSVKISSKQHPDIDITTGLCNTFYTRFKGFMFIKNISPYTGLFFPGETDSRINVAIHMFFVGFDLAVFWLNSYNVIVDKVLAKKGHPFYAPRVKARHILEVHPDLYFDYSTGDELLIKYEN